MRQKTRIRTDRVAFGPTATAVGMAEEVIKLPTPCTVTGIFRDANQDTLVAADTLEVKMGGVVHANALSWLAAPYAPGNAGGRWGMSVPLGQNDECTLIFRNNTALANRAGWVEYTYEVPWGDEAGARR